MKNRSAFWVVLLVILVVMCCCSALIAGALVLGGVNWGLFNDLGIGRDEITAQFSRTLDVTGPHQPERRRPGRRYHDQRRSQRSRHCRCHQTRLGHHAARVPRMFSVVLPSAQKLVGSEVQVRATGLSGSLANATISAGRSTDLSAQGDQRHSRLDGGATVPDRYPR